MFVPAITALMLMALSIPAPAAAGSVPKRVGQELGAPAPEEGASGATALARARLGLSIQSVDADLAEALGLKSDRGALVTSVLPGAPGDEAGIKRGDLIVRVDDAVVRDAEGLMAALAKVKAGREADFTLWRGIRTLELTVTPGVAIVAPPRRPDWDEDRDAPGARLGLKVSDPDKRLRRRYGIGSGAGVVVLEVAAGSRAEAAGIREGDFIVEADRRGLAGASDLQAAAARGRARGKLVLLVRRGDDFFYAPVRFR